MDGVRCPGAPTAALPLLLWLAALDGDSRVFGCGIREGVTRKQWEPGVMQLDGVWDIWVRFPPSLCWTQWRWWLIRSSVLMAWVCADGRRRMTAIAGQIVSRTAAVHGGQRGVLHLSAPGRRVPQ